MSSSNHRDEEFLKMFGKKVKQLRKNKAMSQIELAEKLHFSQPQVANIEKGKTDTSISRAKAIAKALGVELGVLFIFGDLPANAV